MQFYIDVLDVQGNKLGSGPITSASGWRSTARMDRAGDFSFTLPASDDKAALIQEKRRVRCMARLSTGWAEIGSGIVDSVQTSVGDDGDVTLTVSGQDMVYELAGFSAGYASIAAGGEAIGVRAGLDVLRDIAANEYGSAWVFDYSQAAADPEVYALLQGESLLTAVGLVAEGRYHFRTGGWRTLDFFDSWVASGLRAVRATGNLAPETCAITSLRRRVETHDLFTRIVPFGSGQGHARLTLAASNRSIPAGYTGNMGGNWLQRSDAVANYGRIDRWVEFKGIGPIANTDLDVRAAANALFDAAKAHLDLYSQRATHYELALAQCDKLLLPGMTIRLDYRDVRSGFVVNQDLHIIEATVAVDGNGVRTTSLVVSDQGRWPVTDSQIVANRLSEARVYQAHPQLNANSYVTAYTKNVDADNTASFRFRFGREVTQLQQVLFEFQLLPFESTLKSIGTETGASQLETGGPSTNSTGSGGLTSTGMGGPTATGSGGGGNTGGSGTLETNANPFDTRTTGENPLLSRTTGGSGQLTTAGSGTLTTNEGGGSNTGEGGGGSTDNSDTLETGDPQGGDVDQNGHHNHAVRIIAQSGSLGPVELHWDQNNDLYFFASPFVGGLRSVFVTPSGIHTHDLDPHTHAIDPHTHAIDPHTHTIPPHTHTISPHTHTIPAHTHTMPAHTHTTPAHTHTIPSHTHTMPQHTHSLSQHTHSLSDHTHSLAGSIRGVYGIFRDNAANMFGVDELEYRVNGGAWLSLGGALPAGDGWYQLDVTSLVMDSTTFRPLRTNNLIEVRGIQSDYEILQVVSSDGWTSVFVHNWQDFQVGQSVRISGTTHHDGDYTVDLPPDNFVVSLKPGRPDSTPPEVGGTLTMTKLATIDAQLSVRNIIQAVSYA